MRKTEMEVLLCKNIKKGYGPRWKTEGRINKLKLEKNWNEKKP